MFEKCANCATRVVMGKRDENGIFCSKICQNFYRYPGFCNACNAATTPQVAGSTYTMNGIGTHLYGAKNPCAECGSTIQTKFFVVLFIPLIPLGRYRTKWTTPSHYISRKIVKNAAAKKVSDDPQVYSTMGR